MSAQAAILAMLMVGGAMVGGPRTSLAAPPTKAQIKKAPKSKLSAQDGPADDSKAAAAKELVTGGATLTAWGKVGGRKWSVCAERSAEAARALAAFSDAPRRNSEHAWTGRARACPNSIEVLQVAARKELIQHFDLPDALTAQTDFKPLREAMGKSQAQAKAWLLAARREAQRQQAPPPEASAYWLARESLISAHYDEAAQYLRLARREGGVSSAALDQLDALVSLFRGDLQHALWRARLGLRNSPLNDRASAQLVYALVLDRLGDDEGADRQFVAGRSAGAPEAESLDTVLPLSERLYFRGRLRMAQRGFDERGAIVFFAAYIEQSDVSDAHKAMARAHLKRLSQMPGRLGG